jgi:hypothetical protein
MRTRGEGRDRAGSEVDALLSGAKAKAAAGSGNALFANDDGVDFFAQAKAREEERTAAERAVTAARAATAAAPAAPRAAASLFKDDDADPLFSRPAPTKTTTVPAAAAPAPKLAINPAVCMCPRVCVCVYAC